MKKYFYIIIFLVASFGVFVLAQDKIEFPVPELGNCSSKEECKIYCDRPENINACLDFAVEHGMMSKEKVEQTKRLVEYRKEKEIDLEKIEGPGGCKTRNECEEYCQNPNNMAECIEFAEEHSLIPPQDLEQAKKIAQAIKQGATPPPCQGQKECDLYCSRPEHMEECITFAEAAGLIPQDELEEAKKVLKAIKQGATPPPCQGKEACDAYCSRPEHIEECVAFAEAAGLITQEEALLIKETGGKGPGGCVGEQACKAYCDDSSHMQECMDFAVKYGFMSPEEAEKTKKMMEAGMAAGPGGCQGQEECKAYCNDLSHMEECIDFAVKAGFMTPEEAEQAKKMAQMGVTSGPGGCQGKEECEAYCNNPDNVQECIEFGEKMGIISPDEAEKGLKTMMQGGPGGCKTKEKCEAYCSDPAHTQECIDFSLQQGFISTEEAEQMMPSGEMPPPSEGGMPYTGPGGCKTAEECTSYCSQPEHSEECQNFAKPAEEGYTPPPEGYTAPPEGVQPPKEYTAPPEGVRPPAEEYTAPPEGYTAPPEGKEETQPPPAEGYTPPPETIIPSPEIISPPPEEAPQSLLDIFKLFLGNIGAIFEIPK